MKIDEISCFLKFGEHEFLPRINKGFLYFSNAETLRKVEEKELKKGHGDRNEGKIAFPAQNAVFESNTSDEIKYLNSPRKFNVTLEVLNKVPVFCLYACKIDECVIADEQIKFHISRGNRKCIEEHFYKADAVAIIRNPQKFIEDIKGTVGTRVEYDFEQYFQVEGTDVDGKPIIDGRYIEYLTKDSPEIKVDGGYCKCVTVENAYKSLFCKDIFFEKEQEFRLVLPEIEIDTPREIPCRISQNVEIFSLNDFWSNFND